MISINVLMVEMTEKERILIRLPIKRATKKIIGCLLIKCKNYTYKDTPFPSIKK